jgi:hypothetical protein
MGCADSEDIGSGGGIRSIPPPGGNKTDRVRDYPRDPSRKIMGPRGRETLLDSVGHMYSLWNVPVGRGR